MRYHSISRRRSTVRSGALPNPASLVIQIIAARLQEYRRQRLERLHLSISQFKALGCFRSNSCESTHLMVKCQRDVILWISPTTGSPGALGHLAADMQPVLVVPSAPGLHSGWGSGRSVKYCLESSGRTSSAGWSSRPRRRILLCLLSFPFLSGLRSLFFLF